MFIHRGFNLYPQNNASLSRNSSSIPPAGIRPRLTTSIGLLVFLTAYDFAASLFVVQCC